LAGRRQNDTNRRGERRKAADAKPARRGWRLWLRRLILWGLALALLAALFVGLAVAFAARSLPSFYQLQATQVGRPSWCARVTAARSSSSAPAMASG
jgi:penicillin-binding protein 1A